MRDNISILLIRNIYQLKKLTEAQRVKNGIQLLRNPEVRNCFSQEIPCAG
jgi:hypothetical protein